MRYFVIVLVALLAGTVCGYSMRGESTKVSAFQKQYVDYTNDVMTQRALLEEKCSRVRRGLDELKVEVDDNGNLQLMRDHMDQCQAILQKVLSNKRKQDKALEQILGRPLGLLRK